MKAKLETEDAKTLYKKRKQTVGPFFATIKRATASSASGYGASNTSPTSGP
jgi:hypothetical protein